MTFKPTSGIIVLLSYIITASVLLACKKKQDVTPLIVDEPSSLSIISVSEKDINKFVVTLKIKTQASFIYDDYGVIISKNSISNLESGRVYSLGTFGNITQKIDSCLLDSLDAYTLYHLKVFAKKDNRTYLSTDKTLSVEGLKIVDLQASISRSVTENPFASRGDWLYISTNFIDNTENIKETKVKIGGIEANVVSDFNNVVTIIVPDSVSPGKQSISLQRNGLMLVTTDTLDILRGRYKHLNDFPFDYRSHYGSCQIGNVGYMIGGSIYALSIPLGCYNDILTYDITMDKWSTSSYNHHPKDWIIQHELFTANNKIYSVPGRDTIDNGTGRLSSGRIFEFDPAINTWTEKTPFPGARRYTPYTFVANNKIYVFGGYNGSPLTDLWEYIPQTDSWLRKADFPGISVLYPAIFTYNNKVYVFGGIFPQSLVINDFWEYDVLTDVWQQLPTNYDIHERYRSVSFSLGNKGYILGGTYMAFDAFGLTEYELNDSWEFDFDTKKWSRISNYVSPDMPNNFTSFYAKSTCFIKGNNSIIYDKGKMIQFTPD